MPLPSDMWHYGSAFRKTAALEGERLSEPRIRGVHIRHFTIIIYYVEPENLAPEPQQNYKFIDGFKNLHFYFISLHDHDIVPSPSSYRQTSLFKVTFNRLGL